MSDAERGVLDGWCGNDMVDPAWIAEQLVDEFGVYVSGETVARHSRGGCRC